MPLARLGDVAPVLGAVQVVVVGILAVVRLCADGTRLFKGRPRSGGGGRGLVGEDLFGEDFRGQRGQGCNAALEVVATETLAYGVPATSSRVLCDYSLPVSLHVRALQLARPEGNLARVACEGVGGLHGRHVVECMQYG
jgi:hypothetical protein